MRGDESSKKYDCKYIENFEVYVVRIYNFS